MPNILRCDPTAAPRSHPRRIASVERALGPIRNILVEYMPAQKRWFLAAGCCTSRRKAGNNANATPLTATLPAVKEWRRHR